jgi:hypothetical protein
MFKSKTVKRVIASALATATSVLTFIPGTSEVVAALIWITGILGGVGVSHAAIAGTLGANNLATLSSVLSALVLVFQSVPELAPYAEWVLYLAGVLGIPVTIKKLGKV